MATRELIINAENEGVEIALLEDRRLVELHRDVAGQTFNVGDVVWAYAAKLLPSLNAAFIEIGHHKNGFLHYSDLGPHIRSWMKYSKMAFDGIAPPDLNGFKLEPETVKTGKMSSLLQRRSPILVQITKEPISTKGHRLSSDISLPGRYMVLMPFYNHINISKKIANPDERKRLQRLMESIKPKNFGVIMRTNSEGKSVAELHEEVLTLMNRWKEMTQNLRAAQAPKKVLSEMDKTSTILRDLLDPTFNRIVTNDRESFQEVKTYISKAAPDKAEIVQLYNGKIPIFDQFEVTKQIKATFGKTVQMSSGAYLVIEHTEALHVIDVNSGNKMSSDGNQEANALKIDQEAAVEIARQLRLRDIGGIIVIDFIDVRDPANKKLVYQTLADAMKPDKARHTILPMSKFGLVQITRERIKPQLNIETTETCPTCNGEGTIGASILLMDKIEKDLDMIMRQQNQKKVSLVVHEYVEGYIKNGGWIMKSIQWKWYFKYKRWINVDSTESMALTEYHFYDAQGEEIEMNGAVAAR